MMLHELHDNYIIELPFSTASTTPFSISPRPGAGFRVPYRRDGGDDHGFATTPQGVL